MDADSFRSRQHLNDIVDNGIQPYLVHLRVTISMVADHDYGLLSGHDIDQSYLLQSV